MLLFSFNLRMLYTFFFFFFNDTATTEIYTLSLHDALPISAASTGPARERRPCRRRDGEGDHGVVVERRRARDRKSTRLNSSHPSISYAVFCLKKKKKIHKIKPTTNKHTQNTASTPIPAYCH